MKNFLKIAEGQDFFPIVHSLKMKDFLWDQVPVRKQAYAQGFHGVSDILLRFQELEGKDGNLRDLKDVQGDMECRMYDPWYALPEVRPLVMSLMARVGGVRLGRVIISRIAPGGRIDPHADNGLLPEYYQRYQVCLLSAPGVVFQIEDEAVGFATGEVWWINHRAVHSVVNNSAHERLALVVDIRVE